MPVSVPLVVTIYTMTEACKELALRRGRAKAYSRKRLYELAEAYLPEERVIGQFLTDQEIDTIAKAIKSSGRPVKNT